MFERSNQLKLGACEKGSTKYNKLAVNYLYRYGVLIVFANCPSNRQFGGASQDKFPEWLSEHREMITTKLPADFIGFLACGLYAYGAQRQPTQKTNKHKSGRTHVNPSNDTRKSISTIAARIRARRDDVVRARAGDAVAVEPRVEKAERMPALRNPVIISAIGVLTTFELLCWGTLRLWGGS
ncbi:hypothetical protein EDB92DRAFT_2104062 [Lactarius akahatsu]|uniref:Uncharacterized protein n=1 Tax=Lactarius akahatsu TaxID=416441 RepID=A0AAD4LE77_9AGAM|nr:hypothetical protein EDB92DRAFT_2104062 [Lactarius akahatsu]